MKLCCGHTEEEETKRGQRRLHGGSDISTEPARLSGRTQDLTGETGRVFTVQLFGHREECVQRPAACGSKGHLGNLH